MAGLMTSAITNPVWLMKTRMCVHDGEPRVRLVSGMVDIYRQDGIRGLYRGFVPGIFGVSHGAIQFMVYEELKKWHATRNDNVKTDTLSYIAMAATSKCAATVVTYPYQVLRSRMQANHDLRLRVTALIADIASREGAHGFYRGMLVNIIRVLPGTCLTFASYETISAHLTQLAARSEIVK